MVMVSSSSLYAANQPEFSLRHPAGQLTDQAVAGLRAAEGLTGGKRRA